MPVRSLRADPPSEDKRWLIINATMRRQGYEPHALIETLHTVQESFGYVDNHALRFVSNSLNVPLSKAFGVVTFYHFFSLKPRGEHSCVVCTGTACYIKGSNDVMAAIEEAYGLRDGDTTPDEKLSLLTARCLGACGLAPAVVVDGDVLPRQTADTIADSLKEIITDGS
jgi:bidirectional [NiFe] hydrogenase diaphorase subunit